MKPLVILARIIFVGLIWSIFFIEGIRVILLINWHFDIFDGRHWQIAYDLWMSGWTIKHSKEWAFVLIIVSFIPLWLTGWAALSLVEWEKILKHILKNPLTLFKNFVTPPSAPKKTSSAARMVKQKKSYKEIRPRATRSSIDDYSDIAPAPVRTPSASNYSKSAAAPTASPSYTRLPPRPSVSPPASASTGSGNFDHSLFKFDDEEDFSFDFDAYDDKKAPESEPVAEKSKPAKSTENGNSRDKNERNQDKDRSDKGDRNKGKNNQKQNDRKSNPQNQNQNSKQNPPPKAGGNSVMDVLKQKGYEVISNTLIKDIIIDFMGVSNKEIHLILVDKEPGDWLADEERFNDEEPLWFSESSHRISPVRKVDIVRSVIAGELKDNDMKFNVKSNVIVALGNIINAEDMFDIWEGMNISVSRIDRGSPKELKLFAKSLPEVVDSISKEKFEKLQKVIRNIK